MSERKRYRIVQWATGNVGLHALRAVIRHPDFDLVGVKVYSLAKAGRDAGDLCDMPLTGVLATTDIAEVLRVKPDCVSYMPHEADVDDMCRLLEAGINIATSRMEFNYRGRMEPGMLARLEDACLRGGSSLYASGSTPGWFTETMPLALSALERRLDCLTLTDFSDMSSRNSPEMLFQVLHFGADLTSVDPDEPVGTAMSSPPSLSMTADALGISLDSFVTSREFALACNRVEIAAGTIEAGTIAAIRMEIAGMQGNRKVIRRCSTWYVTRDIDADWDLRDTGLHYRIEGDLPLDVMITIPVTAEEFPLVSPGLTAHPVVNSIPFVCEAAPGIRHTSELPLIRGYFGP